MERLCTSTASQLTSPASQKSKDLNKVPLLLQDLAINGVFRTANLPLKRKILNSNFHNLPEVNFHMRVSFQL